VEIDRPRDDDAPLVVADSPAAGAAEAALDGPDAAEVAAEVTEAEVAEADGHDERAIARVEYPAKVEAEYLEAAREHWRTTAHPAFEGEWTDYVGEHPMPPKAPASVDEAAADSVRLGCREIRETEDKVVTPAMRRIEAEDPDRHLVGLEFRCKGEDRIMEKVAHDMQYKGRTAGEALANVKDAIRYTLQYVEDHYTEGVYADVDRLKAADFELVELRNSWGGEQYKGINSRWRVPENEQLVEVQFHTQISFEAKQLTHPAYERLRDSVTTKAEQEDLTDFQRRVNLYVPSPQGALGIPDYP
jgi:hypothetical protein